MNIVTPSHYSQALVFLATAGIAVPLFRRFKVSPVLGFLGAGVLLGPYGLGALSTHIQWLSPFAFSDVGDIAPVAEVGIVFLLFMIGLELSWQRLAIIGKLAMGYGTLQVCGAAAGVAGLCLVLGLPLQAAAVLGFACALSSTAIAIPVLAESKRLGTTAGRTIFAVLLFQDLMVAPLLFMVNMLGSRGGSVGMAVVSFFVPALTALSALVLGGRLVMPRLFRLVAAAGSTEFFMAACFLVAIGTGVLTAAAGLSMELGAFIAGVLLAETEYRREIEVTIDPFRGLLLGLFFVSIGASLDLDQVIFAPLQAFGLALGIIAIKLCTNFLAGLAAGLPLRITAEAAMMLAPGGEFAFIILTAALNAKLLPGAVGAQAMIAVTLSMMAIPLLGALAKRLPKRRAATEGALLPEPGVDGPAPEAIIIGFGRTGQLIGELLTVNGLRYVAIDSDPALVRRLREGGLEIYWGNALRRELLERCGLAKARALIITMDRPADAEEIVRAARARYPDLTIVARARDAAHATHLYALGVSDAVPETIEASLQLSEAVLVEMGVPMGKAIASIHEKRDEFRRILQPAGSKAEARHAFKASLRRKELRLHQPKPKESER